MNQWDELAQMFGGNSATESIPEYAADNVYIAWPSILAGIKTAFPDRQSLAILDYGCGGGLFCRKLHAMGHRVNGYDNALEMIKLARRNVPADVCISDSLDALDNGAGYDVIVSVMVFQFIEDIEQTLALLHAALKPGGVIIYAVFNPAFVEANVACKRLFSPVLTQATNHISTMELKKGVRIPFYIRTQQDYCSLFAKIDMKEIVRDHPPFTPEFLSRYTMACSTEYPEFLIQAFR